MKGDVIELKRMLADRAQTVCEFLLPEGVKRGSEWVHDPGHGKLKVELRGSKAGTWSHFGGHGGGDLIDLWMRERGQDMREALKDIRDYLGVEQPREPHRAKARSYNRPIPVTTSTGGVAWDYLTQERKLSPGALQAYDIGVLPDGVSIAFRYYVPDAPDPVLIKVRRYGDGEAPVPTEADCERVLFGWQAAHATRRICIVEGELDAPSGWMYLGGSEFEMPVFSVPFGGGGKDKQAWVEAEFERLQDVEEVWLALDDDTEGDAACEAIAARLGRHKCRRVRLPRKDFNDCLREGVEPQAVLAAFAFAEDLDPVALKRATDFADEVKELFHPQPEVHTGYTLPFQRIGTKFLVRPGEMSIWSGDSGSGKSQLLTYCLSHWTKLGARTCVASLEMRGARTLARAVRQAGGIERPSTDYVDRCLEWFAGQNPEGGELFVYDLVGKATIDELLEVFTYARMRYGCDNFIIDSLMRLRVQSDDYAAQEEAVYRMVDWVTEQGVHLHLVAHNRKPKDEGHHQGQTGVKGAMEIAANAANQMEVVRVRRVEQVIDKQRAGRELTEKEQKLLTAPGVFLYCNKQRNGDWEGRCPLWFDQDTYRYRDREKQHGLKEVYVE